MARLILGTFAVVLFALAAFRVPPSPAPAPGFERLLAAREVVTVPAGAGRWWAFPEDGPLDGYAALVAAGPPAGVLDVLRYGGDGYCPKAAAIDLDGQGPAEVVLWRETGIQWHIFIWFFRAVSDRISLLSKRLFGDDRPEFWKDPETGLDRVSVATNVWSALGPIWGQSVLVFASRAGRFAAVREYRRLPAGPWETDDRAAARWETLSMYPPDPFLDHWAAVTGAVVVSPREALVWWHGNRDRYRAGDWYVFPRR